LFLGVGNFRLFRISCQLVQLGSMCQIVYEFCAKIHKKGISPIEKSKWVYKKLASISFFKLELQSINQSIIKSVRQPSSRLFRKLAYKKGIMHTRRTNQSQSFTIIQLNHWRYQLITCFFKISDTNFSIIFVCLYWGNGFTLTFILTQSHSSNLLTYIHMCVESSKNYTPHTVTTIV